VGSYRIPWYASDAYGESAQAELMVTVSDAIGNTGDIGGVGNVGNVGNIGTINAPIASSSSGGGGGGSLDGDLTLWSLALLALGRRIRRH
jgi:hypothetical protein